MISTANFLVRLRRSEAVVHTAAGATGGWLAEEWRQLSENAAAVRRALPKFVFYYLCAIYAILALLVWWVPPCDFDTMTSYLARIQLERIGPLRETGTLELQYIFPKFFDYLHAPLLDWGWFITLPNFALFTATLVVVVRHLPPAVSARFISGLAIAAPVIAAVTSAKNDVTLGLIGLLCWFWIYYSRPEKPWYLPGVLLLAAMLVGTKWHGLALAPMLGGLAVVRAWRERAFGWPAFLLLLVALPLAWRVSSADVYLENLQHEGSICPTPDFLNYKVGIRRNLWVFGVNNVLETFEVPFYCSDAYLHTKMWPRLQRWTKTGKAWNYLILPNADLSVFGLPMLLVIAGAAAALLMRQLPTPVRACALVSLVYCAVLLLCLNYTAWINRYFLPTYLFGLIPSAYLAQRVTLKGLWKWAFYSYLMFVSAHATFFHQQKRLVPFDMYVANDGVFNHYKSIFADKFDRDALYFHLATGHLQPYQLCRERMKSHHNLLVVNSFKDNNVPFLYPFIRGRTGYNTRIVNLWNGQTVPGDLRKFDFVMSFGETLDPQGFEPLFRDKNISLYERKETEELAAAGPSAARAAGGSPLAAD